MLMDIRTLRSEYRVGTMRMPMGVLLVLPILDAVIPEAEAEEIERGSHD